MQPFNLYFISFFLFILHQTFCLLQPQNSPFFKEEEFNDCVAAIIEKFGGNQYRYDIAVYALWNLTVRSFQNDETRYAWEYYMMFADKIFAYNVKSPRRFCESKVDGPINKNNKSYVQCAHELLKFGITKKDGLLSAFYYNDHKTLEGKDFATAYLKKARTELEVKQSTKNPDDFCANRESAYKSSVDDLDGEGWEIDNK